MKEYKVIKNNSVELQPFDVRESALIMIDDIVTCTRCHMNFHEIYLSERSNQIIAAMQEVLNSFIQKADEAIRKQYGDDVYIKPIAEMLINLKKEFNTTHLKLIKK